MCVRMYMCIMCTCVFVYVCIHVYMHRCICLCMHICVYVYVYTCICICVHASMCMYVWELTENKMLHVLMKTFSTENEKRNVITNKNSVWVHMYMCECVHMCMHCICACIGVCIYMCVCVSVCVYFIHEDLNTHESMMLQGLWGDICIDSIALFPVCYRSLVIQEDNYLHSTDILWIINGPQMN